MCCLQESYESECQMALQGRIQEQTNETKNALEAFIYATRSKLSDPWYSYATEAERTNLSQKLEKMEVHLLCSHMHAVAGKPRACYIERSSLFCPYLCGGAHFLHTLMGGVRTCIHVQLNNRGVPSCLPCSTQLIDLSFARLGS